jgi:hypothetical protein
MPSRGQEFRLQVNSLRSIWATCCARIFSRHDLVVGPNARLRRRPRKDDGEIHAAKARRGGVAARLDSRLMNYRMRSPHVARFPSYVFTDAIA